MDSSSDSDYEYRLQSSQHVDTAGILNSLPDRASYQSNSDSQDFKSPVEDVCQCDEHRTIPRSSKNEILDTSSSSSQEFLSPGASAKGSSVSGSSHEGISHFIQFDDLTNICHAPDSEKPTVTGRTVAADRVSCGTRCDSPAFQVKGSCKFISQGIQCNVVTNSQETQCDIPLPTSTASVACQSDVPYFHVQISEEVQCDLPVTTSVHCQCDILKPDNTSLPCQSDEPVSNVQISQVQCNNTDFILSNTIRVPQDHQSVSKALQCDLYSEQLPIIMLPPLRNEVEIESTVSSSRVSSYVDDSCVDSNKTKNFGVDSEENYPLTSVTEKFEGNTESCKHAKQVGYVPKFSISQNGQSPVSVLKAPEVVVEENTLVSSQEMSADELLLEMHDVNYKTKSQGENDCYLTSQPLSVDPFSMELCSQLPVTQNDTVSNSKSEEQKTCIGKDSTSSAEENGKLSYNILSREGKQIPCAVATEDTASSMPWFHSLAVERASSPESLDEELSGSKSLSAFKVLQDDSEINQTVKKCEDTQRSKMKQNCLRVMDSSSSDGENDKQQRRSSSTRHTTKVKHKNDNNDCNYSNYVTHRKRKKMRKMLTCSEEKLIDTSVNQPSKIGNRELSPPLLRGERRIDLMPLSLRCERASSPESIDEDMCKELSMAPSSTRAQLVEKMLTADHSNLKSGAVRLAESISSGSSIFQMKRKRKIEEEIGKKKENRSNVAASSNNPSKLNRKSGSPDSSIICSGSSTCCIKSIVPYDNTDSDSDNVSQTNSTDIQKKKAADDLSDMCSNSSRDSSIVHKQSVHCHRNSGIIRPCSSTPNRKNIEPYYSTSSDLDNMSKNNSPDIQKKKTSDDLSDMCSKRSRVSSVVHKQSVLHHSREHVQQSDDEYVSDSQSSCSVQRLQNHEASSERRHQNSNSKSQIICDITPSIIDSDSDNDWFNFPKKQRAKRTKGAYTFDERQQILNYIIKKKKYACTTGVVLWQDMEKAKVCEGRTWQSMKEHFRKQILPRIESFSLEPSVKGKFISLRK